jgi:hypothetical protein
VTFPLVPRLLTSTAIAALSLTLLASASVVVTTVIILVLVLVVHLVPLFQALPASGRRAWRFVLALAAVNPTVLRV